MSATNEQEVGLKIVDVKVQSFHYKSRIVRDSEGHGHPRPPGDNNQRDAKHAMLTVVTDEGAEGYCFGPTGALKASIVEEYLKPVMIGENVFQREKIWQHLSKAWQRLGWAYRGEPLTDVTIAIAEMALWDLAGRYTEQPVHQMLGGYREKVPAYASTTVGDEFKGGLSTPEEYAQFAERCVERGYKAIKLHTWCPPIPWAPDWRMDAKACAAVREAVGPDITLMLDPGDHFYSRMDAFLLGRELEKLNYYWYEEPMDERSVASYAWLADQLDIPVIGPEAWDGKFFNRAEWIIRGACDILRAGTLDNGGIGPVMKTVHLAEAFGMACEIHSPGAGSLHCLAAMGIPGQYYERGLLHPFLNYEKPPAWLNSIIDPMDDQGFVSVPQRPGLGEDINFDYIYANAVEAT